MIKVVIDTNVIISGLLSPYGLSAEIIRMFIRGDVELYVDPRIMAEYEEVLRRPKFGFDKRQVGFFMDFIRHAAIFVTAAHIDIPMKDQDDKPFLEVASASGAFCIITGNVKHYPSKNLKSLKILTPKKFLATIKNNKMRLY